MSGSRFILVLFVLLFFISYGLVYSFAVTANGSYVKNKPFDKVASDQIYFEVIQFGQCNLYSALHFEVRAHLYSEMPGYYHFK